MGFDKRFIRGGLNEGIVEPLAFESDSINLLFCYPDARKGGDGA